MCQNADIPRSDLPLLLIEPTGTEPYYTRSNEFKISDDMYQPSANQTQCYRALLHQVSLTCRRLQTYPGQVYPLLIEPRGTESYYTR